MRGRSRFRVRVRVRVTTCVARETSRASACSSAGRMKASGRGPSRSVSGPPDLENCLKMPRT